MWNLIPWKKNGLGGALTAAPFEREFSRIRSDFDSLFDRMWNQWPPGDDWFDGRLNDGMGSGLDFDESETHYVVNVTAPGFEPGDFDVSVRGKQLAIKAERKESQNGNGGSSYRYGRIQRIIPLPDGAQTDLIEAQYKAGILSLTFPKGAETQPKRIPVKSA